MKQAGVIYAQRKRKCSRVIEDASQSAGHLSRSALMEQIGVELTPPPSPSM